jgi:protein transport protein SEC61 subunit alpha
MGIRVLSLVRPVLQFLPEVPALTQRISLRDRALWTVVVLLIFLVCSQVPLYGIAKMGSDDPLYWTRVILASNRGTLMELGISPIVNAGMIMQLLAGAKIIDVDQSNPEDKQLFQGAQKLLAVLIGFFEAFAYVWSGMYGDLNQIGVVSAILLILQLTFASILVQLLDEMLSKGYGIGSAISLFIATNVCEDFLWKSFSPMSVNGEYEGAILALLHAFVRKNNKFFSIQ